MKITEAEIYELEKSLIKKFKRLIGHVKPRKIKFVRGVGFSGCADKELKINEDWLKTAMEEQLIELLKHELAHYAIDAEYCAHSEKFMDLCKKLGCSSDDLSYSFGQAMDESRLFGMAVERINENMETIVTFKKRPNWEVFESDVLYGCSHVGDIFKILRKGMRKSRKEVAKKMGISDHALKRLEAREDWYPTLEEGSIIKWILDKHGIDGEYRKKRDREIFKSVGGFVDNKGKPIRFFEGKFMPWDDDFQKKLFKTIVSTKNRKTKRMAK